MAFVKVLLAVFVIALLSLLFTLIFVLAQSGKSHAIGLDALKAITIYSPLYWLVLVVLVGGLGWLFKSWLFTAHYP